MTWSQILPFFFCVCLFSSPPFSSFSLLSFLFGSTSSKLSLSPTSSPFLSSCAAVMTAFSFSIYLFPHQSSSHVTFFSHLGEKTSRIRAPNKTPTANGNDTVKAAARPRSTRNAPAAPATARGIMLKRYRGEEKEGRRKGDKAARQNIWIGVTGETDGKEKNKRNPAWKPLSPFFFSSVFLFSSSFGSLLPFSPLVFIFSCRIVTFL